MVRGRQRAKILPTGASLFLRVSRYRRDGGKVEVKHRENKEKEAKRKRCPLEMKHVGDIRGSLCLDWRVAGIKGAQGKDLDEGEDEL